MSFAAALLAALAPAVAWEEALRESAAPEITAAPASFGVPAAESITSSDTASDAGLVWITRTVARQENGQVRIEQRSTIRVTPRQRGARRDFLGELPDRGRPRLVERQSVKCVPIDRLAGVEVAGERRLILYLRGHRMVSALLERSCRSRAFYSGFYMEERRDGRLCAGRDTLLSRSGDNCKLSRLRELVADDD